MKPIVIGVAGGSGSGKSTVAREILRQVNPAHGLILEQDSYYKSQDHIPLEERKKTNYDHPLAYDNDLLLQHLERLLQYKPIQKPVYDFTRHTRSKRTILVQPKDVVIVEGILVLEDARLRQLMDIKVYVDTDADVRFIRRLRRDMRRRGRSMQSVIDQYLTTVRPMHRQFVEPTRRYADIIIPEGGQNRVAIDLLVTKIRSMLDERKKRNGSTADRSHPV